MLTVLYQSLSKSYLSIFAIILDQIHIFKQVLHPQFCHFLAKTIYTERMAEISTIKIFLSNLFQEKKWRPYLQIHFHPNYIFSLIYAPNSHFFIPVWRLSVLLLRGYKVTPDNMINIYCDRGKDVLSGNSYFSKSNKDTTSGEGNDTDTDQGIQMSPCSSVGSSPVHCSSHSVHCSSHSVHEMH